MRVNQNSAKDIRWSFLFYDYRQDKMTASKRCVYNSYMKVDKSKLKAAGMVAAVIAVVGVIVIVGNGQISLTKGVSADLGDLAVGKVTVMSQETYDTAVKKLNAYFAEAGNKTAQDTLITEVVNILKEVQR